MKTRILLLSVLLLSVTSCLPFFNPDEVHDLVYVRVIDRDGHSLIDSDDPALYDGSVHIVLNGTEYPVNKSDLTDLSWHEVSDYMPDYFNGMYLAYDWMDELCLVFDVEYNNKDNVTEYTIIWKDGSEHVITKHSKRDLLHIKGDDYTDWYLDGEGVFPPFNIVIE